MPNFRRYYQPNAYVFITNVTYRRAPYLESPWSVELLFQTMRNVQRLHPFRLFAYVILPDHFHWLMRVDNDTGDFSRVMKSVKRNYTLNYKKAMALTGPLTLWQPRFWDHVIRDAHDFRSHVDHIHWNPVKHGYVRCPEDWRHSTYTHWLSRGYYRSGWGHDTGGGCPAEHKYD